VTDELFDITGRRRSPATQRSFRAGKKPPNAGKTYKPAVLSPQHVERLLDLCKNNPAGLRDRAIISVLYRTGMTAGEVIDLMTDDIDLTPGAETLAVRSGRLVSRRVALDSAALSLLRPWLDLRTARYPEGHAFCIVQGPTKGGRWDEGALREHTHALGRKLGWERLVPGEFRHSFIADLIIEQWPIPYIQAQLGVTTLESFYKIFEHLGVAIPSDEEVGAIIRTRHWPLGDAGPEGAG
jgi:integrase